MAFSFDHPVSDTESSNCGISPLCTALTALQVHQTTLHSSPTTPLLPFPHCAKAPALWRLPQNTGFYPCTTHTPPPPPLSPSFPFYFGTSVFLCEIHSIYWKLKYLIYFMLFWNLESWETAARAFLKYCAAWIWWSVLCPFPVLTICKYFDGICQSPSLYFRTSPVCGGQNSKQVAWPSLYQYSNGERKGTKFRWNVQNAFRNQLESKPSYISPFPFTIKHPKKEKTMAFWPKLIP